MGKPVTAFMFSSASTPVRPLSQSLLCKSGIFHTAESPQDILETPVSGRPFCSFWLGRLHSSASCGYLPSLSLPLSRGSCNVSWSRPEPFFSTISVKFAPTARCSRRFSIQQQHRAREPLPNLRRSFQSEAHYHPVADTTLDSIQDAVEEALDQYNSQRSSSSVENEINNASGVLTIQLTMDASDSESSVTHTWVINKQTPNRQIWFSSPISGPKRFEFNEQDGKWYTTKDMEILLTRNRDAASTSVPATPLGVLLSSELRQVLSGLPPFEISV
jgi:iron donor protein CyaY